MRNGSKQAAKAVGPEGPLVPLRGPTPGDWWPDRLPVVGYQNVLYLAPRVPPVPAKRPHRGAVGDSAEAHDPGVWGVRDRVEHGKREADVQAARGCP